MRSVDEDDSESWAIEDNSVFDNYSQTFSKINFPKAHEDELAVAEHKVNLVSLMKTDAFKNAFANYKKQVA